jgi:hypothetical protein
MSTLVDWLSLIITTFEAWSSCRSVRILETQQFSAAQFALKVRAELHTGNILQVRLYHNHEPTDYAYHFIHGEQALRWDNKEYFPALDTYPHHFPAPSGEVQTSPLTGDPGHDLPLVLNELRRYTAGL